MQSWDVKALDVKPHLPEVLHSGEEGRTIVINLPAGEQLQEHQVHERAWIVVVDGRVELREPGGSTISAEPGWLSLADPNERHELRALSDARILLLLAPWPGEGHPSQP
jgi:quercetin dioxygenase-like cupin family protein